MSQAFAAKLTDLKNNQFVDSSLYSIREEVEQVMTFIANNFDTEHDVPSEEQSLDVDACKKMAAQLEQIASVLAVAGIEEGAHLVSHLQIAFNKLLERNLAPDQKQRQAIFESSFMLSRYLDFVQSARQSDGEPIPVVLAPSFFSLASAGLAPFQDESELAGTSVLVTCMDEPPGDTNTQDNLTLRRMRKMYQVALIGLLRNESAEEQMKLVVRAAKRCSELTELPLQKNIWQMLLALVEQFQNDALALTPQRRHFFARFDRQIKGLMDKSRVESNSELNRKTLKELVYLLEMADKRELADSLIDGLAQVDVVAWTEQTVIAQRRSIECGLKDSLSAMSEAMTDKLADVKQRLGVMAESEVCEDDDVQFLLAAVDKLGSVLQFCGFDQPAQELLNCRAEVANWQREAPEQSDLLMLANAVLLVENALHCYSLNSTDGSVCPADTLSLEEGLRNQAHKHLFEEMQANLSLANRAISSYMESSYDREHIANIANCLNATVGAFKIIGAEDAARLIEGCAKLVEQEYKTGHQDNQQRLESLADCLVSTDYLLHELAAGRSIEGAMSQLVKENLAAIEQELAA